MYLYAYADRLNSMLVDSHCAAHDEYLGDNVYIRDILRQISRPADSSDE